MVKFKRLLITIFFIGLILLFIYGYIQVYTNSYNVMHRDKIVALSLEYTDNTLKLIVCGKTFNLIL